MLINWVVRNSEEIGVRMDPSHGERRVTSPSLEGCCIWSWVHDSIIPHLGLWKEMAWGRRLHFCQIIEFTLFNIIKHQTQEFKYLWIIAYLPHWCLAFLRGKKVDYRLAVVSVLTKQVRKDCPGVVSVLAWGLGQITSSMVLLHKGIFLTSSWWRKSFSAEEEDSTKQTGEPDRDFSSTHHI